jgi:hypothetical protein
MARSCPHALIPTPELAMGPVYSLDRWENRVHVLSTIQYTSFKKIEGPIHLGFPERFLRRGLSKWLGLEESE